MNKKLSLLSLACMLSLPAQARADFKTWTGGAAGTATSWSTGNNWSPVGVPAPGDFVNLYGLSNVSPVVNYDYAPALIFAAVTISHSNPDPDLRPRSTTLNIGSFSFSTGAESVGDSRTSGIQGWGIVNQTGATNTVTGSSSMLIGVDSGKLGTDMDRGTYNLSNGVLNVASGLIVAVSGEGFFNQTGGTVTLAPGSLTLAQNASATARYTLGAGTLTAGQVIVGGVGSGTVTQTGGYASFSSSVLLGQSAGATGVYSYSGGSFQAGSLSVGSGGSGQFTQNGGFTLLGGGFIAGNATGASGTATISNGSLSCATALIGINGNATVHLQAGSIFTVHVDDLIIGANPGSAGLLTVDGGSQILFQQGPQQAVRIGVLSASTGTLTLSGAGTAIHPYFPAPAPPTGFLTIGVSGVGTFNMSAGALCERFAETHLGFNIGSQGFANIDGPDTVWRPGNLFVGVSGGGTVTMTGGAVLPSLTSVGYSPGSRGVILVNGTASSWITAFTDLGRGGPGTISITGGAFYRNDGGRFDMGLLAAPGVLIVDGPGSKLQSDAPINLGKASGGPGTLIVTNGALALVRDLVDNGPVSTITLDGGILDLQFFQIGPTNPLDNLNLRAGTLKNVTQINGGTTGLVKTGPGTLTLPTGNGYTGGTTVQEGMLVISHPDALAGGGLTLNGSSHAQVQLGPGSAARLASLTIAGSTNNWTAQLDLTDSAAIVNASPAVKITLVPTLRNQINSGNNGGAWNGNGITSSTAALDPANVSVALVDNADLHFTSFRGKTVSDNDLIIAQAGFGDANLDLKVDAFDLNLLATHWQQQQNALWSVGDFTGDGKVDAFDLNVLAVHWQSGTSLEVAVGQAPFTVPEPTTGLMLVLPGIVLAQRRQRRICAVNFAFNFRPDSPARLPPSSGCRPRSRHR